MDRLVASFAGLSENDRNVLLNLQRHLPLLADLTRADLLLYVPSEDHHAAVVVAHAQPHTVAPIHSDSQLGRTVSPLDDASVFRALRGHLERRELRREAVSLVQEVYPVVNNENVIAALGYEMSFLELDRQRKRSVHFRRALAQLKHMAVTDQLHGGAQVTRLGEHDGIIVADKKRILYVSTIAENFYRKAGVYENLLGRGVSYVDNAAEVFFDAQETGFCAEKVVEKGDMIWVQKAIPLVPTTPTPWYRRIVQRRHEIDGAILVIQDITEKTRKDQELRIKSTMLQEIHHRVKNNLQTIAALLRLQTRRTGSPIAHEILQQTINRILSIAVVHEYLSHDESSIVDLNDVGTRIIQEVKQSIVDPEKRLRFGLEGDRVTLPSQQATSCALIINELLQNAVEHGYPSRADGNVRVAFRDLGETIRVEVVDDGQGIDPAFSISRDNSLGLQIVKTLVVDDLKGQFELLPRSHSGTRAVVTFPRSGRKRDGVRAGAVPEVAAIHPHTGERWVPVPARSAPARDAEVAKNLL
ncbi:MAG: histidine kinase N-terminal domain-containing protein [Chloroflexi bacterium]|nr:histidine kinase N-terminal domain-containing protein [Chloroflexota bacterium]